MSDEHLQNQTDPILTWFSWLKTIQTIRSDREQLLQTAALKIPSVSAAVFDIIEKLAHSQLELSHKSLSTEHVRVLSHKYDEGEYFVIWQFRGKTDMSRYSKQILASKVRENMAQLSLNLPPS